MKELIRLIDITTNTDNCSNLHHLFLTIFSGQIHYLVGLHGSGKSTLCNILCGQLPFQSGTLIINENVVSSYTPQAARSEGIIAIDTNDSSMASSLSIYEHMEIFHAAKKSKKGLKLFEKKNAYIRAKSLIQEYDLSINPAIRIRDLANEDIFLLYLLEAVYSNAKLVILNLSNLKLSYLNYNKLFRVLHQMNSQGIALLLICDSFFNRTILPGNISIIRKGHIIKQCHSSTVDAAQINHILVPDETAISQKIISSSGSIIGIMELYYSNYSLPDYFSSLKFLSSNTHASNSAITFLNADSLDCFCNNLSIGDNIALVRYPAIAENWGYIDPSILHFLEEEFNTILSDFGAPLADSMEELSTVGKKILGIERWVMAGVRNFVIEDPLFGLDANGQQILLRYFISLRNRNIRLIFVFYNLSELQKICDIVHICDHGKIL